MPRNYNKRKFNDEGLDALYRADPHREYSQTEIAEAAGVERATVWAIERRAIQKIRDEFVRRGILDAPDVWNGDAIDMIQEGFGLEIN